MVYAIDGNGEPEQSRDGLAERWADRDVRTIDSHNIWALIDEAQTKGVPGMEVRNTNAKRKRALAWPTLLAYRAFSVVKAAMPG